MKFYLEKPIYQWIFETTLDNLRTLHEAGVPIVAGSDTPASLTSICQFHGPGLLHEIALLHQAGLSPMEALQAATITPAEMLGLDGEIGSVETGKRANLMIVRDDPLEDISNLTSVLWTVQNGIARTPQEWMQD